MRIVIIEDEHYAAKRLENLISQYLPEAEILASIDTIEESINWFSSHVEPNLIFMDIQLADGLSFQIFDQVTIKCPIIFTTAFDDYAIEAFKVNSVDYILKPIENGAFVSAIKKYQEHYQSPNKNEVNWKQLSSQLILDKPKHRQRFLVKSGNAFTYLQVEDIMHFYSEDGITFAVSKEGKRIMIDYSLDAIETQIDPNLYFRVSRKHIIGITSVSKIHHYLNSRLKIELDPNSSQEIIVSREKVKKFKLWLDQ